MTNGNNENRGLVGWLWDEVRGFFALMFENVWNGFSKHFPTFFDTFIDKLTGDVFITTDQEWYEMLDWHLKAKIIDEDTAENLSSFKDLSWPYNSIMYYAVNYQLLTQYLSQVGYVITSDLRHTLNERERPERPGYFEMMQAAFVAPEKTGEVRQNLKELGYRDSDIDLMFLSMYRLYNENICRTLFVRGELSEDNLFMRMRELGYTDTRIKEITKTWSEIPPISDLITMAFTGAFDPVNRELWPWAYEAPGTFVEWAKKQGLSEDWCEHYWYMHWRQPGVRELFEMMHREAIVVDEMDQSLRASGYSDYWIDKLKKITYTPYARVDVRRMHDLGVLSDEELVQSYKDLGYDAEKALRLAQFTVRYNLETEKTLTKTQIVKAVKENLIDSKTALSELELMGYSKQRAEFLLTYEEYQEDLEYREIAIDNIRDRYQNNLITKQDAHTRLSSMDVDGRRIEVLIDKWTLNKFEDRKIPSKTDLNKFLRNNIINKDRYRQEMQKLGYNWEYTQWYESLVIKKKAG